MNYSCSPNPYEEGTERSLQVSYRCLLSRCSPNPYEEGTERSTPEKRSIRKSHGCSPNPYEEGTESIMIWNMFLTKNFAAAQIPMKRELKGSIKRRGCPPFFAAAQIPMKRELKDYRASCGYVILSSAAAQIPMKRELKGRYSRCGSGRR